MSPLKTQPKQYISFVFYCMNNKLKVSQQHVSSQFSLESIFSDLVLQLVNFEPLGGAKTDPRGKKTLTTQKQNLAYVTCNPS